ncbi:diguanylate cyclase [Roseomonas nepalensis]|uniref:diguanylate cyclase n=1 Tax=Muricoccus nepalensis TaxID=1854500 RepID=A0A502FIK7_9PROT|nr:diguanylate cyclase [Roseomonas nepalensis]TPG49310.1 diguanylate cyclase [Roseomonas nepalensis]
MALRDAEPLPDLQTKLSSPSAMRWMAALGAGLLLGLLAAGAFVVAEARNDTWNQAEQASANLALALEREIARNIALVDRSVQGAIRALQRPGLDKAEPEVRHMALFDRTAGAEYLGSLLVLGPTGEATAVSTALTPPSYDFADREYFTVHRDQPETGLFVSRPLRSRVGHPGFSIVLSRRVADREGLFAGVVAGAVQLAYFNDLFSKINLGRGGSVTLLSTAGRVLTRTPSRDEDVDRDLSGTSTFQRFLSAPSGSFVGKATLDGVTRLYTFRHVADLPLVLSVAVSVDEVFAAWERKAIVMALILGTLCAALVVLCALFRQEMRRRLFVERQLIEAAHTDGLTGLANRRHFDEVLAHEGRRAAREESALSLLMLDLDCFKAFNDRYGHQRGDACLRAAAGVLARAVRRPGDLAARYGGEELAVILPNTDEAGALHLAETIRTGIEALGWEHEGNPAKVVTVSVGCATLHSRAMSQGHEVESLIAKADQALYEAKRLGRNRAVSSSDLPKSPLPPSLPDEERRLAAVAAYHSEDHCGHSEALDRIARLTAGLLGAPTSVISLVGRDEQFFVGRYGLDAVSTPREVAFCAHTIAGDLPLIVPDATTDPRFERNPLVTGAPGIRFYAGMPLVSPEGQHHLGALCVLDWTPRAGLDAAQRALLADLAALTVDELERQRVSRPASNPARIANETENSSCEPSQATAKRI